MLSFEQVFDLPVRLGLPKYKGGLADVVRNPRYATAVGLLLEGAAQVQHGQAEVSLVQARNNADIAAITLGQLVGTPLDPTIKNTPTGFRGSVSPARDVRMAWAMASNA